MGSTNIGLVPDASLDPREKTPTEKSCCLTDWLLHPEEAKGDNPDRKSPDTRVKCITLMKMQQNRMNANGTGVPSLEGNLGPGGRPVANQAGVDRQTITGSQGKREWSRADSIELMECYYLSSPERRGKMKRLHQIYRERGGFHNVSTQNLTDQARFIRTRGTVLSEVELGEIRRRVTETRAGEREEVTSEEQTVEEVGQIGCKIERDLSVSEGGRETHLSPEETQVKEAIISWTMKIKDEETRSVPPKTNRVKQGRVREEEQRVNKVLGVIDTANIDETNDLILAGAMVVTERLGLKCPTKTRSGRAETSKTEAKKRIEKDIEQCRKDLSRIKEIEKNRIIVTKDHYLDKKYGIVEKGTCVIQEILREKIKASVEKIKRFKERDDQYRQNKLFEENQKKFYTERENNGKVSVPVPDPEEATEFWKGIWGNAHEHRGSAEWIRSTSEKFKTLRQQEDIEVTPEIFRRVLGRMRPWKAPGPDAVQAYWMKRFSALHERVRQQLEGVMRNGTTSRWMTTGRTVLIPKDPVKGNIPSNYRPITCLPIMWKLLTGIVTEGISSFLTANHMMPWEQKGCGRGSRGAKHHLLIDKGIMIDSRTRKTNLAMGWIDYKKAYDMIPHSWIKHILKEMKIAKNIRRLIEQSMENWNTRLETQGGNTLGSINIRRGIFQGDSLSPLLFVIALIPLTIMLRKVKSGYLMRNKSKVNHLLYMDDLKIYAKNSMELESLINTVRIFSGDIGMEFGLQKCAILVMKRGKTVERTHDMVMPDGGEIKAMGEDSDYRYLGVLECDTVKNEKVKTLVCDEYKRRLRSMLKSKLNGGNLVKAINTYAASVVRYTAGIVKWTKEQLEGLDRMTRKQLTLYGALHPRSDVDRLYVDRKAGGRGLVNVEDLVRQEERQLNRYMENSEESIMKAVFEKVKIKEGEETESRLEKWTGKVMHGQFIRQTKEVRANESWMWMTRGSLKRETESLLAAAQDQAIRTNYRRAKIEKDGSSPLCRMCKRSDETVSHIVSECSKLAQTEYKGRHDRVATAVHWCLAKKFGFPASNQWYQHRAEPTIENEKVKLFWDFNIYTDHVIEARRPDIVLVNKETKECVVIDIAVPGDVRVDRKEDEKIEKYRDLCRELGRLWGVRCSVVPVVVGALGTIPKRLKSYMALLDINLSVETIQKSAILGTARILRKVLETENASGVLRL